MPNILSSEQLRQYQCDGVLFPIPILSESEVAPFRAALEELEGRLGGKPKPMQLGQSHLHFRWAYDLATHPAVLDVVEDLIGPNILVHTTSIFSKHPHDPGYIPWHQDGYYWQLSEPHLTTAWIALSDSTVENGCLRVVPGSHQQRLPHVETYAQESLLTNGLEVAVDIGQAQVRDVVLNAGAMSLHHVNMIHGSNPNRSDTKRIGFAARYVAPQVRQALEHQPVILARGRDDYHYFELLKEPPPSGIDDTLAAFIESRRQYQMRRDRQPNARMKA
jgi:Phytanoyl-CoA dioxygenase (PhyH)